MEKIALYIHWPFCQSKCPYCDFNSRPLPSGTEEDRWAAAYVKEIEFYAGRWSGRQISSLYFGGGTPSLMSPQTVEKVLAAVSSRWSLSSSCEITLEANPSSSEREKFKAFRAAGINRLSLGVQALNDEALRFLGRTHDATEARSAIDAAAGVFDRFSFDLIYARKDQTPEAWENELQDALNFEPRHLSLYQLTIEPGTVFFKRAQKETLLATEADLMFEITQELMKKAGLPAYEISNHAAPGEESRHNLTYWHYDDYLGLGPGAHGRVVDADGQRLALENEKRPDHWLQKVEDSGCGQSLREEIGERVAQKEALMMGLRLAEGINSIRWQQKFGASYKKSLSAEKIKILVQEGLLEEDETGLRASDEGRQKCEALLRYLLD